MVRVIGHVDLDYFYAQVEEVQDPSIRGRPVIVCVFSGRTAESGVVSTANYRARELGVSSGMPITLAKKKLANIEPAVVKMDREKYETVSRRIMGLVEDQTDVFEQTGIDEAFFDISASTAGDYDEARKTGEGIKTAILEAEHLTCSVGIGRSKAVAKLASDMSKPGGLLVVKPDATSDFLHPLPVKRLYGVGPKTAAHLKEVGVETIGELSSADATELVSRLGRSLASYLLAASKGEDDDPVTPNLEPTQFSRIVTLKRDTRDPGEAFAQLSGALEDIQRRLSESRKSFRTVAAIGILTDLSSHTKSKTFEGPTNEPDVLRKWALSLLTDLGGSVPKDLRRVGLRVSGLDVRSQPSLSDFAQSQG